jgi:hypothetical protein
MRCQILWTAVGFRLDDAARAPRSAVVMHQMHPDEFARDPEGGTRVKVAR